jgi:hypothetical protein
MGSYFSTPSGSGSVGRVKKVNRNSFEISRPMSHLYAWTMDLLTNFGQRGMCNIG